MPSLVALLLPFLVSAAASVAAYESSADAAAQARALLHDPTVFGVGTLSSIYPDDFKIPQLRGRVASGPEYFAPCFDNGDIALMALTVSQNWRNVLPSFGGSGNATLTIGANPDPSIPDPRHSSPSSSFSSSSSNLKWDPSRPQWRRGMPSKNRITLFGSVQELSSPSSLEADKVASCYLKHHKDASHWAPGSKDSPHSAIWVRLSVQEVYSIGGYGDEHAIRFLPMDEYRRVDHSTAEEAEGRLDDGQSSGSLGPSVDYEALFGDSVTETGMDRNSDTHNSASEDSPQQVPLLRFQSVARNY
ncbi:unnamed protein product [Tilletia controversa]|uniref:CREG-like beta-barrel domain-containing protein n=2 Tax=Tilletia TaxID=13289 RepID=A0A177VID4_9BASI|nr:hypothetical protein CF336_g2481 [Tilletia laevis]KAE8262920.1 hypothetical protein A4X03_0g2076 [Tilletia caries]CAD6912806.1 unnamed protein product [Tilletia controversa]KAE8206552.1 hypothetical protein CF335_g1799 [Tilletia laevis]CAD6887033.1 unnamed protein product [Tilletia caries]